MSKHINTLLETLLTEILKQSVTITAIKLLGGGINHAMHLTTSAGDFFAKWNDQPPADLFVREAEALAELRQACTLLKIPQVIASKPLDEQPAVLITEYLMEGNQAQQNETLGCGIAELHHFEHQLKYGFYQNNYCGTTLQDNQWNSDWVNFFGQQRILPLVRLIEERWELSVSDRQQYERLINRLPHLIGHQPPASLNHGDLWSGNYLYTTPGPALVDPACYYADREFDLAMMRMFGGYSSRVWAAYQEAYPLPSEWKSRQNLYMLYHYLNHYYLFGGGYGQQALSIVKQYL